MNAAPHKDINSAPHNNPPDSKKLAGSTECSVSSALALSGRHPDAGKFYTSATIRRFTGGHQTVPREWMSATGLRPLLLGDPVLLWLEHFGDAHGFTKDPEEHSFLGWIGAKGQQFEAAVVRRWAPGAVQVLSEDWDVRDVQAFLKTLQALDGGHEVLTKCALWGGDAFQVYGTADIIAKSSWVYKNWPHLRPDSPEPEHYCILDVKFMKNLEAKGKKTELKMASSQIRMYSWILGHLQGFMPPRAFLLCRDGPVAVPVGHCLGGPLDPELAVLRDRHLDIKLNGANYLPGRDAIVAPGFSNLHDEPWHGAKKRIATEFIPGRPLHWLPRVGDRQAEALGRMGVCCLDDLLAQEPEAFPFEEVPGLGPATCAQIRAVLQANRSGQPTIVPARAVPPLKPVALYCDFEFLSNLNIGLEDGDICREGDICSKNAHPGEPGQNKPGQSKSGQPKSRIAATNLIDATDLTGLEGQEMVFQIGCGWEEQGQWRFRCFTAAHEDVASERKMFEQFLAFVEAKGVFRPGKEAALYHWSQAEVGQSARASKRTGLARLARLPWVDVQKSFHTAPIAIPGMWNFGLKTVSNALGKYSPRHAVEYPTQLADGLSAMVLGWAAYEQENPSRSDELHLVKQYLEIDCKSLWQVVRWLRANAEGPGAAKRIAQASKQEPSCSSLHWYAPKAGLEQTGLVLDSPRDATIIPVAAAAGFWWPPSRKQDC